MQGILSAITPGVFDGLILALERYGTKSFAEVAEPAIEYAERRFPMPEEFGEMLRGYQRIIDSLAGFDEVLLSRRRAHAARRDFSRADTGANIS